jgi:hypothetical protein
MRKLLLLLLLIPNLVMAEKWVFFDEEGSMVFSYDEESIKDNKDGTYSLSMKGITNYSEEYIRKYKNSRGDLVRSVMMKVIFSCSPFKALSMESNMYKNIDLTGFLKSFGQDAQINISTVNSLPMNNTKICGKNNITPKPTPTPTPKVSIEDAKSQCSDIGFKAGTERFGECVLELMQ